METNENRNEEIKVIGTLGAIKDDAAISAAYAALSLAKNGDTVSVDFGKELGKDIGYRTVNHEACVTIDGKRYEISDPRFVFSRIKIIKGATGKLYGCGTLANGEDCIFNLKELAEAHKQIADLKISEESNAILARVPEQIKSLFMSEAIEGSEAFLTKNRHAVHGINSKTELVEQAYLIGFLEAALTNPFKLKAKIDAFVKTMNSVKVENQTEEKEA